MLLKEQGSYLVPKQGWVRTIRKALGVTIKQLAKRLGVENMPDELDHVFVVSEWLPKKNYEQELWIQFRRLLGLTLEKEDGCAIVEDWTCRLFSEKTPNHQGE